jgi:hypothetical protein
MVTTIAAPCRIRLCRHPRGFEHRRRQVSEHPWDCGRRWRMKRKSRWPTLQSRNAAGTLRRCRPCCNQRRPLGRQSQHSRSPSGTLCPLVGEEGTGHVQRRSRHRRLEIVSRVRRNSFGRTYGDYRQPDRRHSDVKSTWLTTTATWCRRRTPGTAWGTNDP